MKISYKLQEQDYFMHFLYTASTSENIQKKKRKGHLFLVIGFAIAACYFYLQENNMFAIYFGVVAIVFALFYPIYFKLRYKKYYKKYVQKNYSKHFNVTETIEISSDSIHIQNKIGEGKVNLSEIEKVNEIQEYFFVELSTGNSLVIPKKELTEIDELRMKFKEVGLEVVDDTAWKW